MHVHMGMVCMFYGWAVGVGMDFSCSCLIISEIVRSVGVMAWLGYTASLCGCW